MALLAVQPLGARRIEVVRAMPLHDVVRSVVLVVAVLLTCHAQMLRTGTAYAAQ